jgi:3-methyladenine DNA glycosylase/8-oxoguanine DNA glycosylase
MRNEMTTVDATEARLATHEEICAMRYEQINARLKRIEGIMMKTAGLMLVSMAGTIFSAVWILK